MPTLVRQNWLAALEHKLRRPVSLFLDYDGTLVPIAPRPQDAHLSPSTRGLLRSLSHRIPVVVISGRALRDIRSRVGLRGVIYVGNHGLEIAGPRFHFCPVNTLEWHRFLKEVSRQLWEELIGITGILIEDKGYTLSVHYRLAGAEARRKTSRRLMSRLKPLEAEGLIRISQGKAVWEIRPPLEWDKGKAVLWLLKRTAFQGRWPLYIGDDQTDQDAFRAIKDRGVGILVGPHQDTGSAHYALKDPHEVYGFLAWLLRQISARMLKEKVDFN